MDQKKSKNWLFKTKKYSIQSPVHKSGIQGIYSGPKNNDFDKKNYDIKEVLGRMEKVSSPSEVNIGGLGRLDKQKVMMDLAKYGISSDRNRIQSESRNYLGEAEDIIQSLIQKNKSKRHIADKKIQSAVEKRTLDSHKISLPKFVATHERDPSVVGSVQLALNKSRGVRNLSKAKKFDPLTASGMKDPARVRSRGLNSRLKKARYKRKKKAKMNFELDLGNLMKIRKPNNDLMNTPNLNTKNIDMVRHNIVIGDHLFQSKTRKESAVSESKKLKNPKIRVRKRPKVLLGKAGLNSISKNPKMDKNVEISDRVIGVSLRQSESRKRLSRVSSSMKLNSKGEEQKGSHLFDKNQLKIRNQDIKVDYKDTQQAKEEGQSTKSKAKHRRRKKRKRTKKRKNSNSNSVEKLERKPRPFTLRRRNNRQKADENDDRGEEASTTKSHSVSRNKSVSRKRSFLIKTGGPNKKEFRTSLTQDMSNNGSFSEKSSSKVSVRKGKVLSNSLVLDKKPKAVPKKPRTEVPKLLSTIKEKVRPVNRDRGYLSEQRQEEKGKTREAGRTSREYSDINILMNLIHTINIEEESTLGLVKYSMGRGNNHKLVTRHLLDRQDLETNTFWNSSHLVWTQTPSKRSRCTVYSKVFDRELKVIKGKLERAVGGEWTEDGIKSKIEQSKMYKFAYPGLLDELVSKLASFSSIPTIKSANLQLTNHVKGSKHIGRKQLLTQHVYSLAEERGLDPYSYIPKTYFIREDNINKDIEEMLGDIETNFGFKEPWIIKPGEFSNRGSGIKMGYGKEQIKEFTMGLSEARKGAVILVQKYLSDPVLYKERKFDIRCYALVVKTKKSFSVYWYRDGYARTSSFKYDCNAKDNLMVHLTNEAVQVKCK